MSRPSGRWLRVSTLQKIVREYWSNRPMELAAALSYYTLLSVAPLVLIVVAVAGLVFERPDVEGRGRAVGGDRLGPAAPGRVLDAVLSLVVITLLFALMFKVLPATSVAWRDVWFGAVTTSVLFTLGKSIIGLYLGRASIGSAYGAAGSLVVVTVWVYYASMIVFFGAEVTCLRSRYRH